MFLLISLVLALLPLLGIVYIVVFGSVTTVDGLFTSLMLLAMSGIFALNAFLELRKGRAPASGKPSAAGGRSVSAAAGAGGSVRQGKVESVHFFEAHVGQPNKSIVVLADRGSAAQTLVLDGDVRNALPVGQKVQITLRNENGRIVLSDVIYA